ncbi:MAG: 50S ribosomal protein L22 [Bacteroidales bacterium]|nr:50S ribosomal protein L22 [Bacteroidales bacterium]
MGSRKRIAAEARKEANQKVAFAKLNNCPTSPRKMRIVADMVRGMKAEQALHVLKHSPQDAAGRLYKLLLSAISNWQAKNEGVRLEDANLFVKDIFVDSARMLKRIQTAPQGRAYRIRKRSNHVTVIVDNLTESQQ